MITPGRIFLIVAAVAMVLGLTMVGYLFETNDAGYVQVKQAAGTGNMTVRVQPGLYPQMFADIHQYKISDVYDFNSTEERIAVRFQDSATADISGQIKYKLPMDEPSVLLIHQDFRSDQAVTSQLIRQVVAAAIKQTATLFDAEEVYSTRRSDFIQLVNEQIKAGIYATTFKESLAVDENGNKFIQRTVVPRMSAETGRPVISEVSAFKRYNVELIQLVINDIDFDEKTDALIAKRKEAEQEQVVAKATAERAKQDTITTTEQGKARVAEAEAAALVEKKTAVINAEREKEVAEQNALKAIEEKKAIIAKGEAEAEAAALKVAAGLTPLDKANIDKETAIGVAEKLAQVRFPQMMVIGGGGNGQGPLNPFDAVGLKSFIDISRDMTPKEGR
jgi:regulator of protease activity HflC (stomatin/prohibitin superfamily)